MGDMFTYNPIFTLITLVSFRCEFSFISYTLNTLNTLLYPYGLLKRYLCPKNLVQTPISQFKQKNTPFLLHKSTKWTKISIPSYKKIANPVYFFPEPPLSEWPWAAWIGPF